MLSFAVTAFNEMSDGRDNGHKILQCIRDAALHPAISEIVVVDDGSEDWPELETLLRNQPKVRAFHNPVNLGVFGNKVEAVACAWGDWVMTCDSDNFMDTNYIDRVSSMERLPDVWYCPSFARPKFDYRIWLASTTLRRLRR